MQLKSDHDDVESEMTDLADDRLEGAAAIAAYRGERVRRTRYLISRNLIPYGREGERIVASKRALDADWQAKTDPARALTPPTNDTTGT